MVRVYKANVKLGKSINAAFDEIKKDIEGGKIKTDEDIVKVDIAPGTYREKVSFTGEIDLELEGGGIEAKDTVITGNEGGFDIMEDGVKRGTFNSYTMHFRTKSLKLSNLTIKNEAAPGGERGQAIALYMDSRRCFAENISLISAQDTLFLAPLPEKEREENGFKGPGQNLERLATKSFFVECSITGDVDFIFGGGNATFTDCNIISTTKGQPEGGINGYVSAPSEENPDKEGYSGFTFKNCNFTTVNCSDNSVFLARPWRPYGKCSYTSCTFGPHIKPEKFTPWKKGEDISNNFSVTEV